MKNAILFDLDGTLTDSGDGIINCASLALRHFGLPVPERKAMEVFVGPPLRDTFLQFGVPEASVPEAIEVFRRRYASVGKFENAPYPGIHAMLQALQERGWRLFVATSKPEVLAVEILEKFKLAPYFEKICGATLDSSRTSKEAVIAFLLEQTPDLGPAVMVGDTAFDVRGAAFHHIPTVGVAWGYGSVEDMERSGAAAIAEAPGELPRLLEQMFAAM